MHKRIFALFLSCAILLSIAPVVTAVDAPAVPRPTVNEILNEYHKKSFEAALSLQTDTARSYTNRSSESTQTLEQETVNELTAAGYQAYNVTADNFDSLENTFATDFEEMGMTKDGSYIIVIGGDELTASSEPQSRIVPGLTQDIFDEGGSSLTYTYNGKTYTLRYMYVTAAEDPLAIKTGQVDLLDSPADYDNLENLVNSVVYAVVDYILADCLVPVNLGTIASWCGLSVVDFKPNRNMILEFHVGAAWTRLYTQVQNSYGEWTFGSYVEYADITSYVTGTRYSNSGWENLDSERVNETIYSKHYNDTDWRKRNAVMGYIDYDWVKDRVGDITFGLDGEDRITLNENF